MTTSHNETNEGQDEQTDMFYCVVQQGLGENPLLALYHFMEKQHLLSRYSFKPLCIAGYRVLESKARLTSPMFWLMVPIELILGILFSPFILGYIYATHVIADIRGTREIVRRDSVVKKEIWEDAQDAMPIDYSI